MRKRWVLFVFLATTLALAAFTGPAAAGGKPYFTYLDGYSVVPSGSGDLSSNGTVTININSGKGRLCYDFRLFLFFGDFPPTGAGINQAPPGKNGPEVIDIPAPVPPPDSTHATGCVNADRSVLRDLSRNPADYYAIVYTDQFPGGALRGQFSK
jgi:hypothetical protein